MRQVYTFIILAGLIWFPVQTFAQMGALKGKIIDRETKEPLPFAANVYIYIEKDNKRYGVSQSDADGIYEIKNIPEGEYNLKCSHVGYLPKIIENIKIESLKVKMLDVRMSHKFKNTRFQIINDSTSKNNKHVICEYNYIYDDLDYNNSQNFRKDYRIDIYNIDSLKINTIYKVPSPYFSINDDPKVKGRIVFHNLQRDKIIMSILLKIPDERNRIQKYKIDVDEANLCFRGNISDYSDSNGVVSASSIIENYKLEKNYKKTRVIKYKEAYLWVEQMPEFPGGIDELKTFLKQIANESNKSSHYKKTWFYISCIVKADGSIDEDYTKKLYPWREVVKKILKAMPKWKPGMHNGVAVPVYVILPIKY